MQQHSSSNDRYFDESQPGSRNNSNDIWNPNFMPSDPSQKPVQSPLLGQQLQGQSQIDMYNTQQAQQIQLQPLVRQPMQQTQQQTQQHVQQLPQQTPKFTFNNPWDNKLIPASQQNVNYNQTMDSNDSLSDEAMRRRKSSLIIPPTRAAAPNPFLYESYPTYNQVPQSSSVIGMAPGTTNGMNTNVFQQQQQQLNARFVPSLYNQQDFQRRQSLATAPYSANYMNQHAASASVSPNDYQHTTNGMVPGMVPYRRLSAYPSAMSPTMQQQQHQLKQLRNPGEDLLPQQPQPSIAIPQMQPVFSKEDLHPFINNNPKFRRASLHSTTISPLIAITKNLITTYQLCSPNFIYQTSKNPKRILTKPSDGKYNNGFDNVNSDYILYVNDVLGTEQNRKYLVLDILGQGTFGQVVKCQNLMTKEILAVKVIKSRSEYLNQSITEAKILELINTKIDPENQHHFLRMHDSFVHKNHLCLVFELLSNNLYELLKQNRYHGLSMQLIKIFSKQILDSLCVLKDSKLIHCDLKPENILLCSPDKPDIKVIDFGSSCEESRTVYTYIQSRFYRAPEIILGIPYSTSIDMWSLGCIVAELYLGIPIFPGSSEFNQITRIINTLDYPPNWMLDMGKNTTKFLKKVDSPDGKYRLKTIEEFNSDNENSDEQPGKQYFKFTKLRDIIKNNKFPKNIQQSPQLLEQELQQQDSLIHFLTGILNLNPLERWTPQQAAMHPFITNQPFTGEWFPPGSFNVDVSKMPVRDSIDKSAGEPRSTIEEKISNNNVRRNSLQDNASTTKDFHNLTIGEK